jgi:urease subunit alpha
MIATALMGDANASLATCEPIVYKQMFGGLGKAGQEQAITFVSKYAYEHNVKENLKLQHKVLPCHGASTLKKSDMK